jgi:hypothetical protein
MEPFTLSVAMGIAARVRDHHRQIATVLEGVAHTSVKQRCLQPATPQLGDRGRAAEQSNSNKRALRRVPNALTVQGQKSASHSIMHTAEHCRKTDKLSGLADLLGGLQSGPVFRFLWGKNRVWLAIAVNLFHHRNHSQEHERNYNDGHNILLLQRWTVALSSRVRPRRAMAQWPVRAKCLILITKVTVGRMPGQVEERQLAVCV